MSDRLRRLVLLPLLLAGVALAVAGCEVSVGDKTIDAGSVEEQISRNIEVSGAQVEGVDCPGGQEAKKGQMFDCTVTYDDGSTRTAQVELVDDEGTFRYEVPDASGEGEGDGSGSGSGSGESTADDTGGDGSSTDGG